MYIIKGNGSFLYFYFLFYVVFNKILQIYVLIVITAQTVCCKTG